MLNLSVPARVPLKFSVAGAFLFVALSAGLTLPASARSRQAPAAGQQAPPSGQQSQSNEQQPANGQQAPAAEQQPPANGQQNPSAEQPPANLPQPPAREISPLELIRTAVENEMNDDGQGHFFSWKERKKHGHGTLVERDVQTPNGVVSRVILIDDKPLTAEQQRAEEERIRKATAPEQMRRKQREDRDDDARTRRMLQVIPDAFNFTYVKTEPGPNGHKLVTLKFTPRPTFNPPNRESMVYTGMEGELVVDETASRLAKVDGTLFQDVNFGWGFFGRLYRGGRFLVEKCEVTPAHWDTTRMYLHFDGKVLLFKSLHVEEDETSWDFQPVQPMTVTQALDFLNNADTQNAMAARGPVSAHPVSAH